MEPLGCLGIPEVLCCICDALDESTALSVALVCTAFSDPALDRVWSNLTSFKPLVACLPDDLLKADERKTSSDLETEPLRVMFLQRPLERSDLRRYLDFYAKRVRSLRLPSGWRRSGTWLSVEVLQAMQIATDSVPGALTPLLEDFTWLAPQQLNEVYGEAMAIQFTPCMALFFGPSVTSMKIQVDMHHPSYSDFLIAMSKSSSYRLKGLEFSVDDLPEDEVEDGEAISFFHDYLTQATWPKLTELRVGGHYATPYLTSSTIWHLATMPSLTALVLDGFTDIPSLHLPEKEDSAQLDISSSDVGGFVSLKHLHLSSTSLSGVTRFLQHLSPTNGVTVLECLCYDVAPSEDIEDAIHTIHRHLNPHALKELTLRASLQGDAEYDVVIEALKDESLDVGVLLALTRNNGDGFDISPFLDFNQLVKLQVQINGKIRLEQDLVRRFPEAWPRIRHLNFTAFYPIDQPRYASSYLSRFTFFLIIWLCGSVLAVYVAINGAPNFTTGILLATDNSDLTITSQYRAIAFVISFLRSIVPPCEAARTLCMSLTILIFNGAIPGPRFLQVRELKDRVCSELSGDSSSLLSLLLTNRVFLEAGLDALWKEITEFEKVIIACLPADAFTEKTRRVLPLREMSTIFPIVDRGLTPSDLHRFQTLYAPRIRKICLGRVGSFPRYRLSSEFLEALLVATGRRLGALAPRLKTFHWVSYYEQEPTIDQLSPYLTLFVGSSVTSMNVPTRRDGGGSIALTAARLPLLECLCLSHTASPISDDLLGSSGLDNWASLKSLTVESISDSTIPLLASLRNLEHIKFRQLKGTTIQHADEISSSSYSFCALRQLDIHSDTFETATNFLQHIPPSTSLRVLGCSVSKSPPPAASQHIIDAIAERMNKVSLQILEVQDSQDHN
ncbi:hypothetical protein NMY22_g15543 [Coprinellus aureogranulatus]|nr:hypothetical protein NMY22_g15543 [Coprinellus aureogranulatus]